MLLDCSLVGSCGGINGMKKKSESHLKYYTWEYFSLLSLYLDGEMKILSINI